MTKVFFIQGISGNVLEGGLINNGKFLKFAYGGKYLGECPVPFSPDTIKEIDMVSILNVDNVIEVGYVLNNQFKKLLISTDINTVIKAFNLMGVGNVFVGRREGVVNNIHYIQYLYGYKKGVLREDKLMGVLRVNG